MIDGNLPFFFISATTNAALEQSKFSLDIEIGIKTQVMSEFSSLNIEIWIKKDICNWNRVNSFF